MIKLLCLFLLFIFLFAENFWSNNARSLVCVPSTKDSYICCLCGMMCGGLMEWFDSSLFWWCIEDMMPIQPFYGDHFIYQGCLHHSQSVSLYPNPNAPFWWHDNTWQILILISLVQLLQPLHDHLSIMHLNYSFESSTMYLCSPQMPSSNFHPGALDLCCSSDIGLEHFYWHGHNNLLHFYREKRLNKLRD